MLLSRVAHSLYWTGRYLERAENINRHISVANEFAVELEGIEDDIAVEQWESLVASIPAVQVSEAPDIRKGSDAMLVAMSQFLVDRENPFSVFSSLGKARENIREVSDAMTGEVVLSVNQLYRDLQEIDAKALQDPGFAQEAVQSTHTKILTTLGAIEHTLTRGLGWNYMKFGEALERSQRTLQVLGSRMPRLDKWAHATDDPLYYASWRSLLRSLGTQENYRQEHGPRFVPDKVVRFLVFHKSAPRAVKCGIQRLIGYSGSVFGSKETFPESYRVLGRLNSKLEYDEELIMSQPNQYELFDSINEDLGVVHNLLSERLGRR